VTLDITAQWVYGPLSPSNAQHDDDGAMPGVTALSQQHPRTTTQRAPVLFSTQPHGCFSFFHPHSFCQDQLKCLFQTEPSLQYFKIIYMYTFKGITHHHLLDDLKLYYADLNHQQVHPSHERLLSVSHSQNIAPSPLA